MIEVACTVNGDRVTLRVEDRTMLADAIREECGLTGTHLGCEQGVCGSCTIVLDGQPVRSCLMLAAQAEGTAITTVEGIGTANALHPLQEAFARHGAQQCGFCTPGFLMLALGALEGGDVASDDADFVELLASNVCRCTGYLPILAAVREYRSQLPGSAS